MKFYQPATKREWVRLAEQGRGDRPLERADRGRSLSDRAGKPFYLLVLGYLSALLLGVFDPRVRTDHWQTLLCCLLLSAVAQIGSGTLLAPLNFRPGYAATFFNLPIPGARIFCWVRSRFLIEKAPAVLVLCAVGSIARHGFADANPWSATATALLLMATTFSTMILLEEECLQRLQLRRKGTVVTALAVLWVVVLFFTRREIFTEGNTPEWLARGILYATWIFPPSWCLPGRFENGGALFAVPWIAWGISRWISWPQRLGPHLDRARDIGDSSGDFAGYAENDEDSSGLTAAHVEDPPDFETIPERAGNGMQFVSLLKPLAMAGGGWVDLWVRRMIGENDGALAAALVDLNKNWTKQTNRLIFLFPPSLAILWAFSRYFPESSFKGSAETTLWVVAFCVPAVVLLPISNALPRATASWPLLHQSAPVFTMLPVGVRDLLRISNRISLARCLIACVIAIPIYWATLAAHAGELTPWVACWLVPATCFFWAGGRPLFLWYRLQTLSHLRRGALPLHLVVLLLQIALAIVWLVSGTGGVIFGAVLFMRNPTPDDGFWLPVSPVGGLLTSALSARAVFEIHRWQLMRRRLDWLSSE